MNTKVISARVPVDIAKMFEKTCKQKGISKSKYLSELVATPNVNTSTFKNGGEIEVPEEINEILAPIGGLGVGIITYKAIKHYFPKDKFTEDEIDFYALTLSIASGFASMMLIDKIVKK